MIKAGKIFVFLVFSALFFLSCSKVHVDPVAHPSASAIRFYGNDNGDQLNNMGATADGGFYFGGSTNTSTSMSSQGFIQKTDNKGNVIWYKEYGGPNQDGFQSVHAAADGGFIAVGSTNSYGLGATRKDFYSDCWIVKADMNGNIQWQKTFGNIYSDAFIDVAETPDRGFVAVGYFNNPATGNIGSLYIVKTDQNGNTLWTKQLYASLFYSTGAAVTIGANGDIAIAGFIVKSNLSIDQGYDYPAFILISETGQLLNYNNSAQPFPDYRNWGYLTPCPNAGGFRAEKIFGMPDGYIIMANNAAIPDLPPYSVLIFKVDFKGNIIWHQEYSGEHSAVMNDAVLNTSGGLLISGATATSSSADFWLLNIDANGKELWETRIPEPELSGYVAGVVQSGDNFALGVTMSFPQANRSNYFGFFYTDQNGKITSNAH